MKVILIIDDSLDNQVLLTFLLNANGFQVHCASNGREALSLLRELRHLPDLILLDAQMPIMDGYQFRSEQQEDSRLNKIPVIVMTASSENDLSSRMRDPNGVLLKPLQSQSIIDTVNSNI